MQEVLTIQLCDICVATSMSLTWLLFVDWKVVETPSITFRRHIYSKHKLSSVSKAASEKEDEPSNRDQSDMELQEPGLPSGSTLVNRGYFPREAVCNVFA